MKFFLPLWRIIKFALQNISRNLWLAVTTLSIITLSLFSLSSLYVLNTITNESINAIKDKVDISLYFKPEVSREQILKVEQDLTAQPQVGDVIYVSKEESLEKLRDRFKGDANIIESLSELEANPLGDTLRIKAKNTEDYPIILDYVDTQKKYAPLIQYRNFEDSQVVINRVTDIARKVRKAALIISIVFVIIMISVLMNSLRVAIYSHREEIGIMRLVGATNWFIRGPFWVESILYVLLSSIISALLLFPIVKTLDPQIATLFGNYRFHLQSFYADNVVGLWLKLFLGACVVSVATTSLAMRRYLRK